MGDYHQTTHLYAGFEGHMVGEHQEIHTELSGD